VNYRLYGEPPAVVAVVHGGPGAPGSVSSLAKQIPQRLGLTALEPLLTATTVAGQTEELATQIRNCAQPPVFVIGHSWGAWLTYLLAHKHPELVRKALLIGSGAFDEKYVAELTARRNSRFTSDQANEYQRLIDQLMNAPVGAKDLLLARLGQLTAISDNYCVKDVPENRDEALNVSGDQYQTLWEEGARLRHEGYFSKIAPEISRPVRVIHGANDPTPIEGVVDPIRTRIRDLKWSELARCGHDPWKEECAKELFWHLVGEELVGK
jgi:pimeloyl-ACP methyl ester carboxylesterase